MDYYVVRTDDSSKKWLFNEIRHGKLRQGWGVTGTQLKEKEHIVPVDTWIAAYKKGAKNAWDYLATDDEAEKRYWILYPMVEIKVGDAVIVPKMPDYDKFLIGIVSEPYQFDFEPLDSREGQDDFRHIIPINKDTLRIFHYDSSEESRIAKNKLRGYQRAVNKAINEEFRNAIGLLLRRQSDISRKDLFQEIKKKTLSEYLSRIINLGHRQMEEVVAQVFTNAGFEIMERNHHDGRGGDADIILKKSIPLISDYTDFDMKIYVQVKTKKGIDNEDIEGIDQLVKISEGDVSAIKILLSTAGEFTDKCQRIAEENNVILVTGDRFIEMVAKYL